MNAMNPAVLASGDAERKTTVTLQARLALRGVTLQALGGGYLARAWNLNKSLPDAQAVEAFAEKVGA